MVNLMFVGTSSVWCKSLRGSWAEATRFRRWAATHPSDIKQSSDTYRTLFLAMDGHKIVKGYSKKSTHWVPVKDR